MGPGLRRDDGGDLGAGGARNSIPPPYSFATTGTWRNLARTDSGSDGLVVANRSANDRRGVAVNFSPLPESVRAKFRQVPVVAKE